ncbi:MAG: hypothetical protein ABH950_00710 [Candidatus Altiarchaeota archaeon]
MAKFCPSCGGAIEENWKVCGSCGAKIDASTPQPTPSPSPSPPPEPTPTPSPAPPEPKPEKKKGGKKKWIIMLLLLIIVVVGGIIILGLGGLLLFFGLSDGGGSGENLVCDAPYINSGDDCCLDQNSNGACDNLKGDSSTPTTISSNTQTSTIGGSTQSTTPAPATTITSGSPSPTTTPVTSTSPPETTIVEVSSGNLKEACVNKYGVTSDTILYLYTKTCQGCNTISNYLMTVTSRGGYEYVSINVGELDSQTRNLLGCHYSPSDQINVPQIICPVTGENRMFSRTTGALKEIESFAARCRKNAQA